MNEDDEEMLMSLIGKKRPIWVRTLSHYSKYSPVAKPVLPSDFTVVVLLQLFLHITRAHLKMSDSGSNLPLPMNSVLSCQLNRALRIGASCDFGEFRRENAVSFSRLWNRWKQQIFDSDCSTRLESTRLDNTQNRRLLKNWTENSAEYCCLLPPKLARAE